jgi:hypothetical protein
MIRGSCHCGNVTFELGWEPDPVEIPARACGCTFCIKHGGVWTSNRRSSLRVDVRDPAQISTYNFGTRTADFHVCRTCGVVPVVTSRIEGRLYAVVNVNAFNDVDRARVKITPASFEGEQADARLERRKRGWIGDVRFDAEKVPG